MWTPFTRHQVVGVDDVASTAMLSISIRSQSKMLVEGTDPKKEPHDTIPKLSADDTVKRCEKEYSSANTALKKASQQLGSEENVAEWEEQVQKLEEELRAFQEKHDQQIADKNDRLQKQQKVLDEKLTEVSVLQEQQKAMQNLIDTLNKENGQLKQQQVLPTREKNGRHHYHHQQRFRGAPRRHDPHTQTGVPHPQHVPSRSTDGSTNSCPVCQVRFPRTTNQIDIERHVDAHFD